MIPKIIHQIWLGDQNLIPHELINSWKQLNPDWEHKLWTEDNLFELENQKLFNTSKKYNKKSDIARYEILKKYGGVYIDVDIICMKNLTSLLKYIDKNFFIGYESSSKNLILNGVIGCTPNHELIDNFIDGVKTSSKNKNFYNEPVWITTGPMFITKCIKKYGHDKINILSHEFFYLNKNKLKDFVDGIKLDKNILHVSWGIHLWGGGKISNYKYLKQFNYDSFIFKQYF